MLVVTHLPSVSGLHMASVSRATSARILLSMPSVCVCVCGFCPSQLASRAQCGVSELCEVLRLRTRGKHSPLSQEEGRKEEEEGVRLDPLLRQSPSSAKFLKCSGKDSTVTVWLRLSLLFLSSSASFFPLEERRKRSSCCYLSIVISQCFNLLLFVSCHVFLVVDFHLTGAAVFPGSQFISCISDSLGF